MHVNEGQYTMSSESNHLMHSSKSNTLTMPSIKLGHSLTVSLSDLCNNVLRKYWPGATDDVCNSNSISGNQNNCCNVPYSVQHQVPFMCSQPAQHHHLLVPH